MATTVYLHFLGRTKSLLEDEALARTAVHRYLVFDEMRRRTHADSASSLVPTRDIALAWAADMLRPHAYEPVSQDVPSWYRARTLGYVMAVLLLYYSLLDYSTVRCSLLAAAWHSLLTTAWHSLNVQIPQDEHWDTLR